MATALYAKGDAKVYGPVAEIGNIKMAGFEVPDAWMLTGLSLGGEEGIDICRYFGQVTRIFTFGIEQRSCEFTATFTIMLGAECSGSKGGKGGKGGKEGLDSIKNVLSGLASAGIHNGKAPQPITVGPLSFKGWLVQASAQASNPDAAVAYGKITCLVDVNSI